LNLKFSLRTAASLLLVFATLIFINTPWFSYPAQKNPYMSLTLLGVMILCWRVIPGWRFMLVCVLAGAGVLLDLRLSGYPQSINMLFSSLGLASLVVLGLWTLWTNDQETLSIRKAGSVGGFLLLCSAYFGLQLLRVTQDAHLKSLDLFLYSFDCSLRVPISFLVGQLCQRVWVLLPIVLIYAGLFLPVAVVYGGLVRQDKQKAFQALSSFVLMGPVGVLFYRLFPALGPAYALSKIFPWHPMTAAQASHLVLEPLALAGYMNAMPSLHMAWSLLALWWSRSLPWYDRLLAATFALGTAVATLGTGEHYLIDLVVALPFALFVFRLCCFARSWSDPVRRDGCIFGLLLTLAWLLMLRVGTHFFWISPLIPWVACLFTAGSVVFFLREPKAADLPSSESAVAPTLSVQHE
jgi:hypothetical protein